MKKIANGIIPKVQFILNLSNPWALYSERGDYEPDEIIW